MTEIELDIQEMKSFVKRELDALGEIDHHHLRRNLNAFHDYLDRLNMKKIRIDQEEFQFYFDSVDKSIQQNINTIDYIIKRVSQIEL